MAKGFYSLTSGMLTQNRNLSNISNNLANIATPGYKKDTLLSTTFSEELQYRTGNLDKSRSILDDQVESGKIRAVYKTVTSHEQGGFDDTGRILDFAVLGEGYFQIQRPEGEAVYTRNGSFTIDNEGFLSLQHMGRVLDSEGAPILMPTDKINVNEQGTITTVDNQVLGQIGLVNFEDKDSLVKTDEGMFRNEADAVIIQENIGQILNKTLERSNVDPMQETMNMMSSQRALQSASQALKMYDQLLAKASEIGRL